MRRRTTRRTFMEGTAALTASLTVGPVRGAAARAFASGWTALPDRIWIGPEY